MVIFRYHLSLLASLSHSISSKTSLTLTGPLTFLTRVLPVSFPEVRMTLTWVIPPLDPVLPRRAVTLAFTGSAYIFNNKYYKSTNEKNKLINYNIIFINKWFWFLNLIIKIQSYADLLWQDNDLGVFIIILFAYWRHQ
jgi:hypothetical protein